MGLCVLKVTTPRNPIIFFPTFFSFPCRYPTGCIEGMVYYEGELGMEEHVDPLYSPWVDTRGGSFSHQLIFQIRATGGNVVSVECDKFIFTPPGPRFFGSRPLILQAPQSHPHRGRE